MNGFNNQGNGKFDLLTRARPSHLLTLSVPFKLRVTGLHSSLVCAFNQSKNSPSETPEAEISVKVYDRYYIQSKWWFWHTFATLWFNSHDAVDVFLWTLHCILSSKKGFEWFSCRCVPMCALTLLLMLCILSVMVNMASDMWLWMERTTLSTPVGPSKRPATCIIVSTKTGEVQLEYRKCEMCHVPYVRGQSERHHVSGRPLRANVRWNRTHVYASARCPPARCLHSVLRSAWLARQPFMTLLQ